MAQEPDVDARPFSGAVLAGGRARRFGSDKCRHVYRGRSLLEHALAAFRDASDVMVVGARAPDGSGVRSVADVHVNKGPVGGLHAALTEARYDWVALTACDMPFLDVRLWRYLLDRTEGVDAVVPEGPEGVEPLAGVYRRNLRATASVRAEEGHLSIQTLVADVASRIVPWSEVRATFSERMFLNANRPEDLR